MNTENRRRFFFCVLGLGGIGCLGWLKEGNSTGPTDSDREKNSSPDLKLVERTSKVFGIPIVIKVRHRQKAIAEKAISATFAELTLVERIMSIFLPESQLCQLNREGVLTSPHSYLVTVLKKAEEISALSDGAFDVTIQPLWELYSWVAKTGKIPGISSIKAIKKKVDWRKIDISPSRVKLLERGMAISLNGIAQGFAADRALAILQSYGIENAIVDTGEIGSTGYQTDHCPWTVGIEDPRKPDMLISQIRLKDGCISTSGDYATTFSPDFVYNHIFDPMTGRSPVTFASVSVIASTGLLADALSTAIFVLGYEKGIRFLESFPGTEAFFVFKDGRTLTTAGYSKLL